MRELTYTLLADGPTDKRLIPLLTWLLREHLPDYALQPLWADLRRLPKQPKHLTEKIITSVALYPCDLLFIHRDAENEPMQHRVQEIHTAKTAAGEKAVMPFICVVPIRMQEAWLLFDEAAIRQAAGNPNGREPLTLPQLSKIESLVDPKADLYKLLRDASGLSGHRRQRVPVAHYAYRVADLIDDFSPLRALSAFQALETAVAQVITEMG